MKRFAIAKWQGNGKEGRGELTTGSAVLNKTPYNYRSRFEDGEETNPEELIAAAHAGCFNMKLSFVLGEAGFVPKELETKCMVKLLNGRIVESELILKANVPGIDKDLFEMSAQEAKKECPVSMLLNAKITLTYELENEE